VSRRWYLCRSAACRPYPRRRSGPDPTAIRVQLPVLGRYASRAAPRQIGPRRAVIVAGCSTVAVLSSQATAAMAGGRRFRPVWRRVRACSRFVRIRAGQPFEHDSNVCPGASGVSRRSQLAELRLCRCACPGWPASCGTRGAHRPHRGLPARPGARHPMIGPPAWIRAGDTSQIALRCNPARRTFTYLRPSPRAVPTP
jgi:hypothetical protein